MIVAALMAASLATVQTRPQAGAQADAPTWFETRAGPLARAVSRFAAQAGVDVVVSPALAGRRTPALNGRMPLDVALARLLAPAGARAVRIGDRMYRIEPAPPAVRPPLARRRPVETADDVATPVGDVMVTAAPPVGFPDTGGRGLIDPAALARMRGAPASEGVADLSASVDSTRQGAGRNKLFVRGLADSALNGPLQATVGQYLGDLRLTYGSPDPDLALIDIRRIEVFEGPQGTRFGAGSIGGVVRITPEPPAPENAARVTAGIGVTSGGSESGDLALVVNRRLGDAAVGRWLAYVRHDGGFLDNPGLGRRASDRLETRGSRGILRWTPGRWIVDLTGLAQIISAKDAQTVAAGETRFARTGRVVEPYESTVALAGVTVRGQAGRVHLTSATSLSRQRLDERFDASQPGDVFPVAVDRRQTTWTAASEVRLQTDPIEGWRWAGGAAVAIGDTLVERRRRDLSPVPAPAPGADLERRFSEAALFGEASLSPAPAWRIALGARLSAVRIDSVIRDLESAARGLSDRDGSSLRLAPSLSARWAASPAVTVFARLEDAVRPAGVSDSNGGFQRYQGDRVTLAEIGLRTRGWRDRASGELSVGRVDWRDVQADIVTPGGDMVTDNVGDGIITFVSAKGAWRPSGTIDVSGSLFVNASRLTATRFSVIGGGSTAIPNVAPLGAQLSLGWTPGRVGGQPLSLGADLRYVGQSRLGVGPALDVPQGGYLRTELTARLGGERRALTLHLSNAFDSRGVRYGIGSPYQLSRPQAVPVRPLTVRLGFEAAF